MCKPGQQAKEPFVDWQKLIRDLPPDQQAAAMGKSLYRLWTKGVVPIESIVTPGRVRSLQEVTARQRLSVDQMVKAGVRPDIAAQAHGAVHTPEHQVVEAHRRELIAKIHGAGVGHEQVVKHIGERIASRVVVAPGPSYTTRTATPAGPPGTVIPGIPGGHLIDAAAVRRREADELKALLSKPEIARAALKRTPPKPKAGPQPSGVEPSKAKLVYADEGWEKVAAKVFGRPVAKQEILGLAGAPDGNASITTGSGVVIVSVKSGRFEMTRTFQVGADGRPTIYAEAFHVDPAHQGQGLGADAFGRMVGSARKAGVSKIQAFAARSPDENGYLTWPKFGYDAPIPADIKATLPNTLGPARRISDLMATPEGVEWWKTHGKSVHLTFDLTPGSKSLEVWDAYRAAKARQAASSRPTSAMPTSPPQRSPGGPSASANIGRAAPPAHKISVVSRPAAISPEAHRVTPREFSPVSPSEIGGWTAKNYGEWARSLSGEERKAIDFYTGSGFARINPWLRGERGQPPFNERHQIDPARAVADLDRALDRGRLPENVVAYRGMNIDWMKIPRDQLKPGMVFEDKAFMSMSLDRKIAWADTGLNDDKFAFRIPAGTPAGVPSAADAAAAHAAESELLLGRDTKFRIVEVKPDHIVAEILR